MKSYNPWCIGEIKKAVTENNAESGTAVLVDVRTGEVLAMATAPSYNPNNLANVKDELKRKPCHY